MLGKTLVISFGTILLIFLYDIKYGNCLAIQNNFDYEVFEKIN